MTRFGHRSSPSEFCLYFEHQGQIEARAFTRITSRVVDDGRFADLIVFAGVDMAMDPEAGLPLMNQVFEVGSESGREDVVRGFRGDRV